MFIELALWLSGVLGFVVGCWLRWTGLKADARMLWTMSWVAFVAVLVLWHA